MFENQPQITDAERVKGELAKRSTEELREIAEKGQNIDEAITIGNGMTEEDVKQMAKEILASR